MDESYNNEKEKILDKNSSSLKGIEYKSLINLITKMENYVTEFKCTNIGHIFILIDKKPLKDKFTTCESCDKILSKTKEEFKDYY